MYGMPLDKTKRSASMLTTPYMPTDAEERDIIAKEKKIYDIESSKIVKRSKRNSILSGKQKLRAKSLSGDISKTELSAILDEVQGDLKARGYSDGHISAAKDHGKAKLAKRTFSGHKTYRSDGHQPLYEDLEETRNLDHEEDLVGDLLDAVQKILEEKQEDKSKIQTKRTEEYLYVNRWGDASSYRHRVEDLLDELQEKLQG